MEGIYFDATEVRLAFQFIESLTLTKSTKSGQPEPFRLLGFQKKLIGNLLGWKRPNGARLYRKSYFSVARKNTKTQTLAAIGLYLLVCDEENQPEVYIAAKENEQSALCYSAAKEMVEAHDELRDLIIVKDYKKLLINPLNGGKLQALSGERKGKHGKNPSAVIIDELHEWGAAQEELYDALTTGSQARRQPLELIITTAGSEENSLCYRKYDQAKQVLAGTHQDPTMFPLIYELPKDADWTDESLWPLANPSLGEVVQIEKLQEDKAGALASPAEQNKFRRFYLNQWVNATEQWITLHHWDQCKGGVRLGDLERVPCYGGLDLAAVSDLTAFVLAWPVEDKVYVYPWFWIPERPGGAHLSEKSRRDGVRYDLWVKAGQIETTPGTVTDWRFVTQRILQLAGRFDIREIAFDRWGARDTAGELQSEGLNVTQHGQGYADMTAPSKRLEECVLSGRLVHDGHQVMRWNVDCCSISADPAGNIKPVKPERNKSTKRIDGVVAMVMAIGRAMEPVPTSAWQQGAVVI